MRTIRLGGHSESEGCVGSGAVIHLEGSTIAAVEHAYGGVDHEFADAVAIAPFVDIHAHVVPGLSKYGVARPDQPLAMLSQGDAGPQNLDEFVARAPMQTQFAVSIASHGEQSDGPCYDEPSWLDPAASARAIRRHESRVWGISINLDSGARGRIEADAIYDQSMAVASDLGLPVVLGTGEVEQTDVIRHIGGLRSGDVLTYLFRGGVSNLLDRPEIVAAVEAAQRRGVILDASHGSYSFDIGVAAIALDSGIVPDTLSSDVSTFCSIATAHQTLAIEKAVNLGVDLGRALDAATTKPGAVLGVDSSTPSAGGPATFDIVAVAHDDQGVSVEHVATVRAGKISSLQPKNR